MTERQKDIRRNTGLLIHELAIQGADKRLYICVILQSKEIKVSRPRSEYLGIFVLPLGDCGQQFKDFTKKVSLLFGESKNLNSVG